MSPKSQCHRCNQLVDGETPEALAEAEKAHLLGSGSEHCGFMQFGRGGRPEEGHYLTYVPGTQGKEVQRDVKSFRLEDL